MILRIEDIDPDRSRPEFVCAILDDLAWLGLDWDEGPSAGHVMGKNRPSNAARATRAEDKNSAEAASQGNTGMTCRTETGQYGPYVQSLRSARYEEILAGLQERGLVYPCYCTRKELRMLASAPHVGDEGAPYPGTCRTLSASRRLELEKSGRRPCLRLNTEAAARRLCGTTEEPLVLHFTDGVLGPQHFTMTDCGGDFALRRSDGVFAYQLAVVADDADMDIHEVVRGEDLLLSTPRQLLLFHLLGKRPPRYVHVPLVRDAEGERLAKRHKSLELAALRRDGWRPQDVLSLLGGFAACLHRPAAPAESKEDLLARMVEGFSLKSLQGRRLTVGAPMMKLPAGASL